MNPDPAVPRAANPAPGAELPATPRAPRRYVARLDSMTGVRRELGKLYAEARQGELDPSTASKLANLLAIIARILEGAETERRLAELERQLADRDPWRTA